MLHGHHCHQGLYLCCVTGRCRLGAEANRQRARRVLVGPRPCLELYRLELWPGIPGKRLASCLLTRATKATQQQERQKS